MRQVLLVRREHRIKIFERTNERTNENLTFFSILGGVLRTAAKNRKKCLMKTWHFFRFLAACYAPPPKIERKCLMKPWHFFRFLAAANGTSGGGAVGKYEGSPLIRLRSTYCFLYILLFPIGRSVDRPIGRSADQPIGRWVDRSIGRLADQLIRMV